MCGGFPCFHPSRCTVPKYGDINPKTGQVSWYHATRLSQSYSKDQANSLSPCPLGSLEDLFTCFHHRLYIFRETDALESLDVETGKTIFYQDMTTPNGLPLGIHFDSRNGTVIGLSYFGHESRPWEPKNFGVASFDIVCFPHFSQPQVTQPSLHKKVTGNTTIIRPLPLLNNFDFQSSSKNEAAREFYVAMTTTDNGVHGQGLIFTIDMDSGEILRTLNMVEKIS